MSSIKCNGSVSFKFCKYVELDLNEPIESLEIDLCSDVKIKNINENTHLLVFASTLNELPSYDELTLRRFRLSQCELNCSLPKVLRVKEGLTLNKVSQIKCPEILELGSSLTLIDLTIDKLPDNLEVFGDLDLRNVVINQLPKGLVVHGNLNLINCNDITEIPSDAIIKGKIEIYSNHEVDVKCHIFKSVWSNCKLNLKLEDESLFEFRENGYGQVTYYTVNRKK